MAITGNQSLLVRGQESVGIYSINPVSTANAGGAWQGRRLSPGQLVVRSPDAGIDHISPRRSEYLGLTVKADTLAAVARALTARDLPPPPGSWAVTAPPPADFQALLRAAGRVLGHAPVAPAGRRDLELDGLEEVCLRVLIRVLYPEGGSGGCVLNLPARAQAVRRAEELMRTRLRDPIGVVELCATLGVSDRTLRLMFRERYGCGPVAYYRGLRLNAVRAWLVSDAAIPVAAAAQEFGFTHLGNFAADYRRQFGESPSATRR